MFKIQSVVDFDGLFKIHNNLIILYANNQLTLRDFNLKVLHELTLQNTPSSFGVHNEKLLIGYSNGLLEIYSIKPLHLVKKISPVDYKNILRGTDEGHLGNAVTFTHFVSNSTFISADESSRVFCMSLKGLGWLEGLDKQRLFGRYPLPPSNPLQLPAFHSKLLDVAVCQPYTAILTPTKLIVVSLKPSPTTIYRVINEKPSDHTTGTLAWNNNTLVFNWSNTVYKVNLDDQITHSSRVYDRKIMSSHWIDSNLILLRSPTTFDLVEPASLEILESQPYDTSHLPNTPSSFQVLRKKCFFLTENHLSVAFLLNYKDRLGSLAKDGKYIEALQLAVAYFKGEGGHRLTTHLPDSTMERQPLVQPFLSSLLKSSTTYLEKTITAQSKEALRYLAKHMIEAAYLIDNLDWLFNEIFDIYQNNKLEYPFLVELEPLVRNGKLPVIPPNMSQLLLRLYDPKDHPGRYEELVLNLDATQLDLNGVIKSTKIHKLWKAFIYVHLTALGDFLTPTLELINSIRNDQQEGDKVTLFDYLGYTLSGLLYPSQKTLESIDEDYSEEGLSFRGKTSIYQLLFNGKLHSDDINTSDNYSYPYVRFLLALDSRLFFAVLNRGFEEGYFNDEGTSRPLSRQTIVNLLLEMIYTQDLPIGTITQIEVFVSTNLSKYPQFLMLPSSTILQLIMGLSEMQDDSEGNQDISGASQNERELAVESLLSTFTPNSLNKILDQLIEVFERAKFYKILKSSYRTKKEWRNLIRITLEDIYDEGLFENLNQTFKWSRDDVELFDVFETFVDTLIRLDADELVMLVDKHSNDSDEVHTNIVQWCQEKRHIVEYLAAALRIRNGELSDPLKDIYITALATYKKEEVYGAIKAYDFNHELVDRLCVEGNIIDARLYHLNAEGLHKEAFDYLRHSTSESADEDTLKRAFKVGMKIAIDYAHNGSEEANNMWFIVLSSSMTAVRKYNWSNDILDEILNAVVLHTDLNKMTFSTLFRKLVDHFMVEPKGEDKPYDQLRSVLMCFMDSIRSRQEIFSVARRIMDRDAASIINEYSEKRRSGWSASEKYRNELDELRKYNEESRKLSEIAEELEQQGVDYREIFEIPPVKQRVVKVYQ
ncbi:hypothetical protein E3Q18_02790 [Wallemia mellicola]|uniref:Vacuolar protein sorting-associated protein 8 central domain-containing protein n=1 Tax=Wallemia mellicola TaxID=1708541 RepID=A0A4V4MT08_9BASI|nr:hypothetical protein E3Q24_02266 [Wallemia mellicola]TIB75417.1 hypothetical protein E3Q23_02399 [Wallemia mellicola]TIB90945.1 hypothetical protein E3Q21_00170 [Wallemia mellicola]TIB92697.1 hypothetical protein E3Q20_00170 [Wallemia mellicola]TIB97082.1 hypothetical protein E3Q18_02790 [Wallemia mellicola]